MAEVDEGPSEWETFREEDADLQSARVALETLKPVLEASATAAAGAALAASLEELLDEGETLLQEFRGGNEQLLERLCTTESVRSLVQHATRPPCEGVPPERLRHRSHTAAELLAMCGQGSAKDDQWKLRLVELFFAENGMGLMDLLWGFLLDVPVDTSLASWNVLAGYFCNVVLALLHHFPNKVAGYLRDRGDVVFTSFIFFLGTRCIAELFAVLICLDIEGPPVFPVDGLMIRLVQQFSGVRPDGDDADEHLALVIKTVLSQACSNSTTFACAVVEQMSSFEVLGTLLDKVVDMKSAAAASVVSMAVSRFFHLTPNPLLPMRGPNLLKPLEEETPQEIPEAESYCLGIPEASSALVQCLSKELPRLCDGIFGPQPQAPRLSGMAPSVPEPEPLREAIKMLLEVKEGELFKQETWDLFHALASPEVEEVLRAMKGVNREENSSEAWLRAQMLSRLRSSRAAAKLEEHQMRQKMQRVPFSGELAVEATFILVELNRTQDSEILQVFLQQDLLTRCLHHILTPGPPGSVMLNTVCALCLEVIRGPQNASIQAVCRFLEEGNAMGRLANALSTATAFREAAVQKTNRDQVYPPELTGLLRKICAELRDAAGMSPEVQERLDSLQCWTEVVLPDLEEFAQLEQEPLGGFPKLESPSFFPVNMEDAGFTAEDLRDIDEDLDTEFLLDLGKLSQRQAFAADLPSLQPIELDSWHLGSAVTTANDDDGKPPIVVSGCDEWV